MPTDAASTEMNSVESQQWNQANLAANCCLHRDEPEWKAGDSESLQTSLGESWIATGVGR
jgi:hypothetical protein